eukprot:scaffold166504_cov27-Tisochrysis_lutea.AAC.1
MCRRQRGPWPVPHRRQACSRARRVPPASLAAVASSTNAASTRAVCSIAECAAAGSAPLELLTGCPTPHAAPLLQSCPSAPRCVPERSRTPAAQGRLASPSPAASHESIQARLSWRAQLRGP